ncbi:MAG: ribonuclease H-like domain-containing protein [Anaerolineaceae bacterium]|nr:ribonuclease H-like domain-containing protein [Anaerolineaceae bacterium]
MDPESLIDKLKSMGVQLGANHIPPSPEKPVQPSENGPLQQHADPRYTIEKVVAGSHFTTVLGETFLTTDRYPLDHQHGSMPLCADPEMDVLAAWSQAARVLQTGGKNLVFLDTETSGLAGGTGTYAFLVGIGYRTADGFELVQFFMRDPSEESALLAALDQWLSRFDVVVTFNGKSYDVPLLNTRYQINGLTPPFGSYEHVDVLQIARKLWRDRLPSRALGELEKEIVRFRRTNDEVPGWMIPQLYFDYLRSGDARPLAGVFYHNAIDILTLAALFGYVADLLKNPVRQEMVYGLDLASIARLYEEMGWFEQAAGLYGRSLEQGDLPEPFFFKTIERYARLHRRQNEWDRAVALWRIGAEHGMVSACVELSKFYEHRERNPLEALNWARKAMENLEKMDILDYPNKTLEREIQQRLGRLYQRTYRNFDQK